MSACGRVDAIAGYDEIDEGIEDDGYGILRPTQPA
jgi:hypothetical protein